MKTLKIVFLTMLLLVALTGCGDKEKGKNKGNIVVGEWALVQWSETTPEFHVYVDFNEDGTFEMYQQVWSLDYEYFNGTYTISGDVLTGVYADGTNWACGYRVNVVDGQLVMYSQEDISVTSVYEKCTISEEIKAEATATRAAEVVPFL
jgi:hypothetical protein